MIPLTQTTLWANLNECFNGLKPYIFSRNKVSCLFGHDSKNSTLTSFGGPVIGDGSSQKEFVDFLNELLIRAKNENIYGINFRALFPLRQWQTNYEQEFSTLGFKKEEWKTFIVDLSCSEEQLFKNFQHSARKGIRKAQGFDIRVRKCDSFEECYSEFLIPYLMATGRAIKEKSFYQKGWDLDLEDSYSYWVAKTSQGDIIGFLGSYRYNSVATEIMSALTPIALKQKIPVQDLLHWEAMKYHQGLGDLYFDLAGFNPNPISEKEKNIKRFKEKWGGLIYDVSSYTLDQRTLLRKVMNKFIRTIHE